MTLWETARALALMVAFAAAFVLVAGGLVFWLSWLVEGWPDGRDRYRRW